MMRRSPFHALVLLVEGSSNDWERCTIEERKQLLSVITSTRFRSNITVVRTSCIEESVALIRVVASSLSHHLSTTSHQRDHDATDMRSTRTVGDVDVIVSSIRQELHRNFVSVRMLSHCHGWSSAMVLQVIRFLSKVGGGKMCTTPPASILHLWQLSCDADDESLRMLVERGPLTSLRQKKLLVLLSTFLSVHSYQ
jgi:ERCC4-type nuclease